MTRGRIVSLLLVAVLAGCTNDAATSAPTTVADLGEAFLAAIYEGDAAGMESLSDGDLTEAHFFSRLVVGLGGSTSSILCEEPTPGLAACRVTGTDTVVSTLDDDREVLDIWDLDVVGLRVTSADRSTILPPTTAEYYRTLAEEEPAFGEACGDFGSDGDPSRCAEIVLGGLGGAGSDD